MLLDLGAETGQALLLALLDGLKQRCALLLQHSPQAPHQLGHLLLGLLTTHLPREQRSVSPRGQHPRQPPWDPQRSRDTLPGCSHKARPPAPKTPVRPDGLGS